MDPSLNRTAERKVLFIGDSIVEGSIGESFTDIMERQNPGIFILNHGVPGDMLRGICRRLLSLLEEEVDFEGILLEGGHNDILMRDWFFQDDSADVAEELSRILDATLVKVKEKFKGPVVLATLSCLGEDLEEEANRVRSRLNRRIMELAGKHGCQVADVGRAFDQELINRQGMGGFYLTMDGVHLNRRGAELYAREIGKFFNT